MRMSINAFGAVALLASIVSQSVRGETLIFVNVGPYRSADVTGHQEEHVNWLDDDLSDDNFCTESFAALELQHYLQKLTGRYDDFDTMKDDEAITKDDLILVGGPQSNGVLRTRNKELGLDLKALGFTEKQLLELGPEGFRIRSLVVNGRRITIVAGGGRVGTLYGAYELLRRLGCRWDLPGENRTDVPHNEKIADMNVVKRIAGAARPCPKQDNRVDPGADFFIWMARNQYNRWYGAEAKPGLMHKLGIEGHTTLSRVHDRR